MFHLRHGRTSISASFRIWPVGVAAGLAGGLAEICWVAIYACLSGGEAAAVARGITETLFPQLGTSAAAVPLGIAIHMGLAVVLGVAIAVLVRSLLPHLVSTWFESLIVVWLLLCVWATNFFLLLPVLNPAFTTLVPYTASLVSKVLFGATAAMALTFLEASSGKPNLRGRRAISLEQRY